MIEYTPQNNPYKTLVADVTHRCNMNCANCYIPNRNIPDMDKNKLYQFIKLLPSRTQIRIIGAEPTMRKDLPEIISTIKSLGHRPVLLTNGLRLSNLEYTRKLKSHGLMHCYISMNGADNDEWYKIIDGMSCAEKKILALKNTIKCGMIPNIGCIIQGNVNREAPKKLVKIVQMFNPRHCVIRIKNVGQIGRYSLDKKENTSLESIMHDIESQLGIPFDFQNNNNIIDGHEEKNSRLFPLSENLKEGQGIWFKLTDWGVDNPERDNLRRGRITQNWTIAPFFEHVTENEFGY
jgi:molybdenum cofactor biosynthesis enzyme MoaA